MTRPHAQRVGRFSAHAVERARERLGVDLSADEADRAWESIETGTAQYVAEGARTRGDLGVGRLYRAELHGVRCGLMVGAGPRSGVDVVITVFTDEDVDRWLVSRRGTATQQARARRKARRRANASRREREQR